MVACLVRILKEGLPTSACLIERVADKLISFQVVAGEKAQVSSSYSSAAEFRTTITDRLMGNQANEHLEAILPFRVQTLAAND